MDSIDNKEIEVEINEQKLEKYRVVVVLDWFMISVAEQFSAQMLQDEKYWDMINESEQDIPHQGIIEFGIEGVEIEATIKGEDINAKIIQ